MIKRLKKVFFELNIHFHFTLRTLKLKMRVFSDYSHIYVRGVKVSKKNWLRITLLLRVNL
jgi:hypothetical protein